MGDWATCLGDAELAVRLIAALGAAPLGVS